MQVPLLASSSGERDAHYKQMFDEDVEGLYRELLRITNSANMSRAVQQSFCADGNFRSALSNLAGTSHMLLLRTRTVAKIFI